MTPSSAQFAAAAEAMVGVRWRKHGRSAATGVDCAGMIIASLWAIGLPIQDVRNYDARMPDPSLLWAMCRASCTEQPWSDRGEGRVGLCRWSREDAPRHLVVMLHEHAIVHVDAGARRVTRVPANWLDERLLAVFRVNGLEYGEPW